MNDEAEVWKDVPGYEHYQVSTLGRLYAKPRVIERFRYGKTERVPKQGRFINATLDSCGYPQVKLYYWAGQCHSFKLHKVVALAFLDNPDNLPFLNHKDGNKQNPRLSNLERCTAQQNTRHAWANGLCVARKGEDSSNAKLTSSDIPVIRELSKTMSASEIGKMFGVTGENIHHVVKGNTWSHVL